MDFHVDLPSKFVTMSQQDTFSNTTAYSDLETETASDVTTLKESCHECDYINFNNKYNYLYGIRQGSIQRSIFCTPIEWKYTAARFNAIFCVNFPHKMTQWPDKYCKLLLSKCIENLCVHNKDFTKQICLFSFIFNILYVNLFMTTILKLYLGEIGEKYTLCFTTQNLSKHDTNYINDINISPLEYCNIKQVGFWIKDKNTLLPISYDNKKIKLVTIWGNNIHLLNKQPKYCYFQLMVLGQNYHDTLINFRLDKYLTKSGLPSINLKIYNYNYTNNKITEYDILWIISLLLIGSPLLQSLLPPCDTLYALVANALLVDNLCKIELTKR